MAAVAATREAGGKQSNGGANDRTARLRPGRLRACQGSSAGGTPLSPRARPAALLRSGLGAGPLDTVVRTGGSSRLPSFRARLDRPFPGKVSARDAFTAVAKGLGARAGELWGTPA